MLKYSILIFFFIFVLFLTLVGRKKIAVQILFFFIPFSANPFGGKGMIFLLGLNAFIVWAIWLGQTMRNVIIRQNTNWLVLSPRVRILYYFLVVGIVSGILHGSSPHLSFAFSQTASQSLFNFSLYIITIILFLKIMYEYCDDYNFHDRLCLILISTTFLQFGSYLSYSLGLRQILPSFLVTPEEFEYGFYRFTGLLGDYELIVDYALIVISLGMILILKGKCKMFSFLSILLAGLIGILSGTRSFLIVSALFMLFLVTLHIIRFGFSKKLFKIFFICIATVLVIGLLVARFIPAGPIFKRFETSVQYFKAGNYEKSVNRDLGKAVPIIAKNTDFWGNGSFSINKVDYDVMVYHNLYLAMYANYGIVGLLVLFYLFGNTVFRLYKIIKKSSNKELVDVSIVLLALFLSLFLQQMKISALRIVSILLLYAFIFLLVRFNYSMFNKETYAEPGN